MGEKKHGSGPYMKATAVSVEQAVMSPGGSQVIADELNQLLRDVRVLQAFVEWMKRIDGECDLISSMSDGWEAADKAKNMEQEMVVGRHLLNECDGALTRWGGGGKE